jgi:hypothetical protein
LFLTTTAHAAPVSTASFTGMPTTLTIGGALTTDYTVSDYFTRVKVGTDIKSSTDWNTSLTAGSGANLATAGNGTLVTSSDAPLSTGLVDALRSATISFTGTGQGTVTFSGLTFTGDATMSVPNSTAILSVDFYDLATGGIIRSDSDLAYFGDPNDNGTLSVQFSFLPGDFAILNLSMLSAVDAATPAPVPVPAALPLLVSALTALGLRARRRSA